LRFSLRHLFLVTTLLAVCLGVGEWCYIKYDDRIRPVTTEVDLQFCTGKRVSLCGRYQRVGRGAALRVIWFGKLQMPIVLVGECTKGSALSQIPDGASIAVTGRLVDAPVDCEVPMPIEGCGRYDECSPNHETVAQSFIVCRYAIEAEDVSVVLPPTEGKSDLIKWL
jgi:hypothetical protein